MPRPRKSDQEKKNRGTYRPSRGDTKPAVGTILLEAGQPVFELSKEAHEIFQDICNVLLSRNAMEAYDVHLATLLALEYEAYMNLRDESDTQMHPDTGLTQPSGARKVKHQCIANIARYSQMLKIVPIARGGLKPNGQAPPDDNKPKSPMDDYF